jgi:thiol-disulfide isomerase/thioredoxin
VTRILALVALAAAVLTGCSGLPESGDKGYVTGTGVVRQLAVADRGEPVALVEDSLDGKTIDLSDTRGKPTVVVVWGAWCVECREEQPDVNAAAEQLEGKAEFVGLDVRDNVGAARSYEREFDVPYPSIDGNDGRALQAFTGTLKPYTVPAFVVLDSKGRVAATIIGALPSTLTLVELVEDVADG